MEQRERESLRERLNAKRRLPVADAISITRDIAMALQAMHGKGALHLAVSPDTIELEGGRAQLIDATATDVGADTPAYLSPEQLAGDAALDARSDLYALGCVLFEMLAGRRPYLSATAQGLLAERRRVTVPQVRSRRETASAALDAIVTSLLAVVPADRTESAEALLAALDQMERDAAEAARSEAVVSHVRDEPEVSAQHALRNAAIGVVASIFALWLGVQLLGSP